MCSPVDAAYNRIERKIPEITPPRVDDDVSNCNPGDGYFGSSSSVVSSLPIAINWLRDYAKENPSFRIQVALTVFWIFLVL